MPRYQCRTVVPAVSRIALKFNCKQLGQLLYNRGDLCVRKALHTMPPHKHVIDHSREANHAVMSNHFDDDGNAHMVDVSSKQVTKRLATASSVLTMLPQTATMIRAGTSSKGDVLGIARIAAIQSTKLTQQLIPLCHSIPIESVAVEFCWLEPESAESESSQSLRCLVTVGTEGKTGVEMEAMTGASVAALTVYDMVKSVDRGLEIGPIVLESKSGGKSGEFVRNPRV